MKRKALASFGVSPCLLAAALALGTPPAHAAADEITYFTYGTTEDAIRFGFWSDCECEAYGCGFYGYTIYVEREIRLPFGLRMRIPVAFQSHPSSTSRISVTNGSVTGLSDGSQYFLRLSVQWSAGGPYEVEYNQAFATDP